MKNSVRNLKEKLEEVLKWAKRDDDRMEKLVAGGMLLLIDALEADGVLHSPAGPSDEELDPTSLHGTSGPADRPEDGEALQL